MAFQKRLAIVALLMAASPVAANANTSTTPPPEMPASDGETSRFGEAMRAIAAGQWDRARELIGAIGNDRLAQFARAELFLAAGSPRVDGADIQQLLTSAPDLPQSAQLARLAQSRGITTLPGSPPEQSLRWAGSSPRRGTPRSVADPAAAGIARSIPARITADDPAGAEQLLNAAAASLSPAALSEWQQRVAWSYYIENDDANARRLAALAQAGPGDWAVQADWTQGLASWRQGDCSAAMSAFRNLAGRARDPELEASGHYWFARAATACGRPQEVQASLRRAAVLDETFYGLLAAESLGMRPAAISGAVAESDQRRVAALPNARLAASLAAVGQTRLADETLRYQARIGAPQDHGALVHIARQLSLPETQLYLAHNAPSGVHPGAMARFPAPNWTPATGWRVNPALVFAHTLQESQFRARVVSPAGAVGLMQVRRGTGSDMGLAGLGGDLTDPATNMALGQSYIEYLRDASYTRGELPRVIAAYNAGPTPAARWLSEVRDNGDPLLFIESIPYWETRAYVGIVLRNLWMYERALGTPTDSRQLIAQGQWPRVPGAPDDAGRRLASIGDAGAGGR